jgi:hypothetical protein
MMGEVPSQDPKLDNSVDTLYLHDEDPHKRVYVQRCEKKTLARHSSMVLQSCVAEEREHHQWKCVLEPLELSLP